MELPADIMIHNELMGFKGSRGRLLEISELGYYEVNVRFGDKTHRVLLPIAETVLIDSVAEEEVGPRIEVER